MTAKVELPAELRKQGVKDLKEVREAFIENDGNISGVTDSEK